MIVAKEIVDSIVEWYQSLRDRRTEALRELVPAIDKLSGNWREHNRLESKEFNLFSFFNPGETTHSRILAFFLNPRAAHGQEALFLNRFLYKLNIDSPEAGRWIVSAEKGRIDVLIKRSHPHSVIIIENKSNNAVDQSNQLYRYWYQEIYQKQIEQNASQADIAQPKSSKYRVLYMAPDSSKTASDDSFCRPSDWRNVGHLPARIPMEIEYHSFRKFVIEWLSESIEMIPESNLRLKEFTKQYIEYWR